MMKQESFRDHISTVSEEGRRIWVYPRRPKGKLHGYRKVVAVVLLAILIGIPFIKVHGRPLFLLDVVHRKFYLFGVGFWPQDFHIFLFIMIAMILFIVLFTVVFGRLWCGWACPQTIFMEMVFRKVEYWIEGNANQQKKLNAEPLNARKLFKKLLKHIIFIFLSWLVTNIFLSWIIGVDALFKIIVEPIAQHKTGFVAMLLFTGTFYWVFSRFREQVCTLVCPYGRLQGVLLDENSIVVHYDYLRGEPRTRKKTEGGDCIDCYKCVDVCPTGIDIRNGTQLECINCTACIDACDTVMEKVKKPKGLIRYASYSGIKNGVEKILTVRSYGYSGVLGVLLIIVTFLLTTRNPVEATVLRTPGTTFFMAEDGKVSNLFNVQILNKSFDEVIPEIVLASPHSGQLRMVTPGISVKPEGLVQTAFFIDIPAENLYQVATPLIFNVLVDGEKIQTIKSSFISPGPK